MKKIAVIIPTYNRANFLGAAINSVLNQSYSNLELVVIDDGSTDNTQEVVAEYINKLTYIKQNNAGCASARNLGVNVTSSEYLAFLDSDDLIAPRKLEIQAGILDAHPNAGFVYSDSIEFGKGIYYLSPAVARINPSTFAEKHFFHLGVRPGSLLIRRDAFIQAGAFDPLMRYNEDSDLIQRLSIISSGIFSGYPSILQRHHGQNKSNNRIEIYKALLDSSQKVLKLHPEFLSSIGEKKALKRISEINAVLEKLSVSSQKKNIVSSFYELIAATIRRRGVKICNKLFRREQLNYAKDIMIEMENLLGEL